MLSECTTNIYLQLVEKNIWLDPCEETLGILSKISVLLVHLKRKSVSRGTLIYRALKWRWLADWPNPSKGIPFDTKQFEVSACKEIARSSWRARYETMKRLFLIVLKLHWVSPGIPQFLYRFWNWISLEKIKSRIGFTIFSINRFARPQWCFSYVCGSLSTHVHIHQLFFYELTFFFSFSKNAFARWIFVLSDGRHVFC